MTDPYVVRPDDNRAIPFISETASDLPTPGGNLIFDTTMAYVFDEDQLYVFDYDNNVWNPKGAEWNRALPNDLSLSSFGTAYQSSGVRLRKGQWHTIAKGYVALSMGAAADPYCRILVELVDPLNGNIQLDRVIVTVRPHSNPTGDWGYELPFYLDNFNQSLLGGPESAAVVQATRVEEGGTVHAAFISSMHITSTRVSTVEQSHSYP